MDRILESENRHIASVYERLPVAFSEGNGMHLKDINGKEYLDFVGGVAVCALGYAHPSVTEAIRGQTGKLVHVSNLFHIVPQIELAEELARITSSSIEKFFFCNSGAEAVETAFKLAFKHTGRRYIVAMEGSYHGRTAATVGATWNESYREPFKNLIPPIFKFAPFDDLDGVRELVNDQTVAVIAEPVQGEGGVNIPSEDFLPGLREICDDSGALLILDEVQSGMCRTGKWFACEHWSVEPDIMTIAKALGNGFPIGCAGARGEIMDSLSAGEHGSTFGGNPLACTAAKAVIEVMRAENIPKRAEKIGKYFKKKLERLSEKHEAIREARGLGLILALELEDEEIARIVVERALEEGLIINQTADKVLRFVPPLIVEKKHIDRLMETLDKILEEVTR